MKNIFSIPNILSIIRIIIIPFFIVSYFLGKVHLTALLIVLSGLTDVVDGFIARRFNMITSLGKALDPIADKLTIVSILFCVCIKRTMVLGLLATFVVKEILMGIEGIVIIKYVGEPYSAKWFGKLSTCLLYLSLLTIILWESITFNVMLILIAVCAISVVLSFVLYTKLNVKTIKGIKDEKS